MSDLTSKYLAALLLLFMVGIAYWSMLDDTAIMDEVAHLPAGYSYITQQDMRLNPEHPPLIKDLAGIAVVIWSKISGIQINFPSQIKAWTQDINGQWDFGFDFMYKEGNPADLMLLAGRLPMLLVLLFLGLYIFRWTKQLWGKAAALMTLFLFSFSPTFIAHGRFMTTDVAAAAGVFIATYYFIRWARDPRTWTLITAGIFFGLAQLAKFSLFLLVPFFGFLIIIWIITKIAIQVASVKQATPTPALSPSKPDLYAIPKPKIAMALKPESKTKIIWRYLIGFILILLIGYGLIVTPVYWLHVKNYPIEKQRSDMRYIMASYGGGADQQPFASCKNLSRITRCPAEVVIWTADKPLVVRAFGQYLFGLLMVVQRAAGGNTTYFMGEVSAAGWRWYFLIVYLLKEPLTLHILTAIALLITVYSLFKKQKIPQPTEKTVIKRFFDWINLNFESLAMLIFIAFYWITSIRSPLNIGVRHVLPTFPFIYALASSQIISWVRTKKIKLQSPGDWSETPPRGLGSPSGAWADKKALPVFKYSLVGLLLAWQAISVLAIYPHFLAYFNEIIGGPKNGYRYVVDSNLDWGQDLKRLNTWTEQNGIQKIYVDYFGGGDAKYYLGDKFQPWWGTKDPKDLKSGDWLAVSATLLQGGRGKPVARFTQDHNYYDWLNQYEPAATIGYSIFVFRIP